MQNKKIAFFISICLLSFLSACQPNHSKQLSFVPIEQVARTATPVDELLVARINDEGIALADYEKRIDDYLHATRAISQTTLMPIGTLTNTVFSGLVDQTLITQAATRENIYVSNSAVEEKISTMKRSQPIERFQHWMQLNQLNEAELFEMTKSQLVANALFEKLTQSVPFSAAQIHARQILVSDQTVAEDVLSQLNNGEAFSTLAQNHSIDEKTRVNGGDLGWFPQGIGILPPPIEAIAFSLADDTVSDIISTEHGYYIIKVERHADDRPLTPQHRYLLKVNTFNQWLKSQRAAARIERMTN